jgi:hypothetical protein
MPGVATLEGTSAQNKGALAGSIDLAVSGGGVTGNLWLIDGVYNNDTGSNRSIMVYPSVDAIAEMKVHRNSYGAEFGGAGGAQVNVATRGGSDDFHGSAFYFGRDEALGADNYFLRLDRPEGAAPAARLRLEPRRPDPEGEAPFLRLPGMEPGAARRLALWPGADGGGAAGDLRWTP